MFLMVNYQGRIEWALLSGDLYLPPPRASLQREAGAIANMKYAIIETGGKQYRVAEGDTLFIEKLNAEAEQDITFDKVLAVMDEGSSVFGTPVVAGASVSAKVLKNGKGRKIRVYKMKPKKGYQRTQGHRQPYTKVLIGAINC